MEVCYVSAGVSLCHGCVNEVCRWQEPSVEPTVTPSEVSTHVKNACGHTCMWTHVCLQDVCADQCIQRNTDYQGSDLVKGGIAATTESQCCMACKKTAGCVYWTFGTDKNKCWVKSGARGWQTQNYRNSGSLVVMSDGGCAVKGDFPVGACQSTNIEQGVDYQGSDLVKGK